MIDVLVAGGGIAGSACAIHLARLGRSVTILDRATFPRRKACGEGLFPAGVRELDALGVGRILEDCAPLERLRFNGYGFQAEAALGGVGIRRLLLDVALISQAQSDGVDVRTGCGVRGLVSRRGGAYTVLTDDGEVEARAIIAADGLNSGLRRQAGLDKGRRLARRYGVSAHVELASPPGPAVDVFFRPGFEVYVTPVGGLAANVAILMSKPATADLAGNPGAGFDRLVSQAGGLAHGWRRLDDALVAGPFPARASRLWSRNLVLAGDAAGFFDGITGEGMSLALVSARHCAEAVDAFLRTSSNRPFVEYQRRHRALARNSEIIGRLNLALASRPVLARRALRGLSRHPEVFGRLAAISSGESGLRSLRPADILALVLG